MNLQNNHYSANLRGATLLLSIVFVLICSPKSEYSANAQVVGETIPAKAPPASPTVDPTFEVATIRPTDPTSKRPYGESEAFTEIHGDSFSIKNASVVDLLKYSYRIRADQIKGGPNWMSELRFEVTGHSELLKEPTRDQFRGMMRRLLAERLHLEFHEARQLMRVYALINADGKAGMPILSPKPGPFSLRTIRVDDGQAEIHFESATIQDLLFVLMNSIQDRQLVDETGLQGKYTFALKVSGDVLDDKADPGELEAALFKAVEAIGFKLRSEKAPVVVYIIDHVERPTPN